MRPTPNSITLQMLKNRGRATRQKMILLSTSLNRCSENIVIKAVIIAELELRNIEVKIFFAHVVEGADDAALEDASKTFNRLGMNRADDVLMLGMVNGAVREFLAKVIITDPLIGAEQANLIRHGFVGESLQGRLLYVLDDAGDYVTLAPNCTNDNRLARSGRTGLSIAFFPMPVLGLAADECFVTSTMRPTWLRLRSGRYGFCEPSTKRFRPNRNLCSGQAGECSFPFCWSVSAE
jgi:hypothetical protein